MMNSNNYPIMAISPLRMGIDGKGITTLVCLYGCPLDCKYCINKKLLDIGKFKSYSPTEILKLVENHNLYYLTTGGGITFGGGEPLQYPKLIREFKDICPKGWNINVETSLNVPIENIKMVANLVNHFYIDIKDVNNDIYKKYTLLDNFQVLENLQYLVDNIPLENITVRVPLIKNFNTMKDIKNSENYLIHLGILNIDIFQYITTNN
ncbi:MAG: radical SAM protein [Oscillospiraceae bacterium]